MNRDPDLLDDLAAHVRRFVVLGAHELVAVVLWIVHTHAIDAAETTGYLSIHAPEKASGKTRLLEVLDHLVRRPWLAASTSSAALVRKIDGEGPTLLLDEVDEMMRGDKERAAAIRGILNAGYRRSGVVTVCVGQGAKIVTRDFHVFGAKALTGLDGALRDTLASRCIPIALKKRRGDEPVEKFREREQRTNTDLHDRTAIWADAQCTRLADARPDLPEQLDDRAADIWEPLIAIADAAGGEWPERARATAMSLASGGSGDQDSPGVLLLRDIRTIFGDRDKMWSKEVLLGLARLEEAPWGDIRGKPLDANGLAKRLRRFNIKTKSVRIDTAVARGYGRDQFEDAWTRYLPAEEAPDDAA